MSTIPNFDEMFAGVTLKSNWHASVAPDAYDPSHFIVSLGDFDGEAEQFSIKGNAPDPREVSVQTGLVKYELVGTEYKIKDTDGFWDRRSSVEELVAVEAGPVQVVVLFQMLETRKLKAEIFPGKIGSQVEGFTSTAKIYER